MATVGFIALDVLRPGRPSICCGPWYGSGSGAGLSVSTALIAVPILRAGSSFRCEPAPSAARAGRTMRSRATSADAETDRRRAREARVTVLGNERFRPAGSIGVA